MSKVAIYALCEPDTGEFRYIGQTRTSNRRGDGKEGEDGSLPPF